MKKRKVTIEYINLLSITKERILFDVKCSKGTYIRSLCEDIAERLETIGKIKLSERTK